MPGAAMVILPCQVPTPTSSTWESTPRMVDAHHKPSTCADTITSFYLKELEKITVADGYAPHLFVAAYIEDTRYLTCWRQVREVKIGADDWESNRIVIRVDSSEWINYACSHPDQLPDLDYVLSRCGFIGVMYQKDSEFRQAHASGVLRLDELRYNIPLDT